MIPTTLDRVLLLNYIRSYAIVLACLLSLYVIVDLFTNLDDFSKQSFAENAAHIGRYYSTRVSQIFDRMSEAITLIGAMFTIAWMQRNNELLPQLSAGISTRRVIRPVLYGCAVTLALGPLNQEFVIPEIADELQTPRDDPKKEKVVEVRGEFDSTKIHIEGAAGFRNERRVIGLYVTFPESNTNRVTHLTAREAVYIPFEQGVPLSGGWELRQTTADLPAPLPEHLEQITFGKYFLHTREVDFESLTRNGNWYLFARTPELRSMLAKAESQRRQPSIAVEYHTRIARPLVGAILVLMGLSIILQDQNRHVFINTGMCLGLCVVFYVALLGAKYLGTNDFLSPALAAWMPVLIFGPISLAMFDAIHT
ncbi:LptF/LptG family permease [Fimbriiglobus ruber]|uniref:Putative membrane protein n=1 Tax=Fimbriiglobus ruber TaxID=1908690 RepID=A0A225EA56_9BACT|nr:LptF/LptG family permease [Fimbriiglobus ruber]OWK45445.1 putative membrane protein [Fimbriiglobus ruber]